MYRLYKTPRDQPDKRLYYCARYRPDGTVVLHRDKSGIYWRWSETVGEAYAMEEVEARRRADWFNGPAADIFAVEEVMP